MRFFRAGMSNRFISAKPIWRLKENDKTEAEEETGRPKRPLGILEEIFFAPSPLPDFL